jgi:hypothetical protein
VRSKRPRGISGVAGTGSMMGANVVGAAGAVHTAQTAHGAHCGAGGAITATVGGGGDAQVANSNAAIDEKSTLAARGKLVTLRNFIVSRVYNCKSRITI